MNLRPQTPQHLTYCLNVHPGEEWRENLASIRSHTLAVRDRVAPGQPFGLGLRLSQKAGEALRQPYALAEFKRFMAEQDLYTFTINGFPYGTFHGKPVKTAVYQPDWSTPERLDYTMSLAGILGQLLPEGTDGSISTVPLGYRVPLQLAMMTNLAECAAGLHGIRIRTGKEVHLGLEPEPDCLLETTEGVIRFFEDWLIPQGTPHLAARLGCGQHEAEAILRRHIGVCFDACHLAIQFEPLAESLNRLTRHGIRISKLQLSAALEITPTQETRARLLEYCDPVYLHQVKSLRLSSSSFTGDRKAPEVPLLLPGRSGSECIDSYPDLEQALSSPLTSANETGLWRIHYHIPLHFEQDGLLHSTAKTMDETFWRNLAAVPVSHLEIETYTFHVLPPNLTTGGIEASIAKEYAWVLERLGRR